jgi:biotin carboxylase
VAGRPGTRGTRLLVLGAGPAQLGLLRAARGRGLETIAVDGDPGAVGFELAWKRALLSSEDEPDIDRLARAESVDGLISPGADWPVGIAARIAARLGLPHPIDPATAALATSKQRQRARLAEAGVPQPESRAIAGFEEGLPVPCVVKAPDRQGQRGLTLVRSRDELPRAIEEAVAASRNGSALVEELVEGPEVTVNAFSVDGRFVPLTVTDRLTADPPAFGVALAHAWPSEHDVEPAVEAARAAAEALGVRGGPTYTQVRLGAGGPRVVELAARLGGGHDAELCEAALGVDLNGLALEVALGDRPGDSLLRRHPRRGACVVFLVAPEGELVVTHGVEEAQAAEGVLDVLPYRRPGHVFGPLRRGPDRAGAVLAVGESRDDALANARRAAGLVRFEVAPA